MLDSFEKESRLQERRAARQRQMQIMEEAASGLPLSDENGLEMENSNGNTNSPSYYSDEPMAASSALRYVDEDSEDDVPSMYSDYQPAATTSGAKGSLKAASKLWGSDSSKNKDLTEDKFKFVMGDSTAAANAEDGSHYNGSSSWRRKEHVESQELLMLAGRRVSGLEIGYYGDTTSAERNRRRYHRCGGWFARYKKILVPCGSFLAVVLIVMGVSIGEKRKNTNHDGSVWPPMQDDGTTTSHTSSNTSGGSSYYNPEQVPSNPASNHHGELTNKEVDVAKFNRIKDRILEHQISHASTLEDVNSAQYKALTWIVRDDPRQLDVASIDDEASGITGDELDKEEALFERYSLVVFWYATTDLSIVNHSQQQRRNNNRRHLAEGEQQQQQESYTQSDIEWKQSTDWLTSSGFCQWHGIVCHPDVMSSNPNSHYNDDFHVAILNLTDNNIHGEIPREVFVGLGKMQALDLSANALGGEIGMEVGELRDLQDLFLQSNQFTGAIPTTIGELTGLYNLNISDNRIGGSIPTQIGKLTRLRDCSLFNNKLVGKIPTEIGDLTDLLALYLDSNKLSGKIPKQIGLLTSLVDLRLRANKFTGSIPTELGALANLETIYLDTNSGITGSIPTEFGQFAKATEIQLYQNSLTGPLPSELGLLDGLVYLYVDSNELTGSIPEEWGGMRNLEQLFVSGNSLKGKIPPTIRGMERLQYFRASDNQFSGTIPTDIGKLLKMEYLYLEENDLDGPVPSELGELYKLKLLHLDGNNLRGQMPSEICELKTNFFLLDLSAANNEDLSCTCCTKS